MAPRTRSSPSATPVPWSTPPMAGPTCGSSSAPATGCATIRGPWPRSSVGWNDRRWDERVPEAGRVLPLRGPLPAVSPEGPLGRAPPLRVTRPAPPARGHWMESAFGRCCLMGDLDGRTFLVTGANAGIGQATAIDLGRRGGRVFAACRSEERARPVLDELGDQGVFLALDLGDLASVRACAQSFLERDEPLRVLVNNAGVGGQRGSTSDGFELTFGVNHLGHFLLTRLLLDRIKDSGPARI